MERKLQSKIIKWLKEQGAYVIKPKAGPGVPVGCPDVIFLYGPQWGAIEVKASEYAPFQPGQQQTLAMMKMNNGWVYRVYPENWPQVQAELVAQLFDCPLDLF